VGERRRWVLIKISMKKETARRLNVKAKRRREGKK